MSRGLYCKMAVTNILKNIRIYVPYLVSVMMVCGIFYIIVSVSNMVADSDMKGKNTMGMILYFCSYIVLALSVIILFYANSFALKQRKKELGLYHILGLEKKQIYRMMFWEVLFLALAGIFGGILSGALLSELAFLGLIRLVKGEIPLGFQIPLSAVGMTGKVFLALFAGILLFNIAVVKRTNPIDLLKGGEKGEKEPKVNWAVAALGALSMGAGYAAALKVSSPTQAVLNFLPAALLVMVGTYCLFIAGSIAVLKRMKKCAGFYYRPVNFISVSGMLYRMRRNAAGLASICILSTAVMVTMGTCLSIFFGEEDMLAAQYPRAFHASCLMEDHETPGKRLKEFTQKHADKCGVTVQNPLEYAELSLPVLEKDGGYQIPDGKEMEKEWEHTAIISFTTADCYEKNAGEKLSVGRDEAVVFQKKGTYPFQNLQIETEKFSVKKVFSGTEMEMPVYSVVSAVKQWFVAVVKDFDTLKRIQKACQEAADRGQNIGGTLLYYHYFFDLEGEQEDLERFFETYQEELREVEKLGAASSREEERGNFYSLYGSIVFIGYFMVFMFLIATVLIMYYKQVTEGYDDRERFCIMQKVGLGDKEIKAAIRKQVLQVFFLPLAFAVLHMAAAYKALTFMMRVFTMYNGEVFAWCLAGTAVFFTGIYFVVYLLTARAYYRIVRR